MLACKEVFVLCLIVKDINNIWQKVNIEIYLDAHKLSTSYKC